MKISTTLFFLLFHFLCSIASDSYSITVATDGTGDFTSIQEAINATKAFPPQRITIFIKNGVYYEKVKVHAWNTDFIFGAATAHFENCTINSKSNSYITAASTSPGVQFGYVFKQCRFTADDGVGHVYLGRPLEIFILT